MDNSCLGREKKQERSYVSFAGGERQHQGGMFVGVVVVGVVGSFALTIIREEQKVDGGLFKKNPAFVSFSLSLSLSLSCLLSLLLYCNCHSSTLYFISLRPHPYSQRERQQKKQKRRKNNEAQRNNNNNNNMHAFLRRSLTVLFPFFVLFQVVCSARNKEGEKKAF